VDSTFAAAKEALENGDNAEAARLADEAWSMLPEPRFGWDYSYACLDWLVETKLGAPLGLESLTQLVETYVASEQCAADNFGARFSLGALYFEQQRLDEAFERFAEANKLSGGHCFTENDPRYRKFFKERRDEAKARARAAKGGK
jgi:thioredoxin-like negative regulator of GroEL